MNNIAKAENQSGTVWLIRYRVPIVPGRRKSRQVTETLIGCKSRRDAEGVYAQRRAALFDGTYRPRSNVKPVLLSAYIETFLKARKGELASWSSYRSSLTKHVAPHFKGKHLSEITTGDFEDYRRARLAAGASKATVRNECRYAQAVYTEARKHGLVSHDPVADMSFKKINIENQRKRVPTPAEILRLVAAASDEPIGSFLRPLFFVIMGTGLRLTSALRLRWENVLYAEGCIGTVQKGGTWVYPPMSDRMRAELEAWEGFSKALGKDGWVFPSVRTGRPLTKTAVQKAWPKFLERAAVEGITRHDLRRFMVTRLRELGADNKVIGMVSGHATAAMIDRYDKRGLAVAATYVDQAMDLKLISDAANRASESEAKKRKLQ